MSLKEIQKFAIDFLATQPFDSLKEVLKTLLNTVEEQTSAIAELKDETQRLKDEINRLKGEKGKPDIKSNADKPEDETKPAHKPHPKGVKSAKRSKIEITRRERLPVDRSTLPPDAQNKGTRSRVIQDISIQRDNIEFIIERFYSPSHKQTIESTLPENYRGHEFGPNLRAFVITLHYQCRITQKVLHTLLRGIGIIISEGQIGEILLDKDLAMFQEEKEAARVAAIEKHGYQQIDDTGARLGGENHFTIVTCNPDFCSFMTSASKNRLSALRGLSGGMDLKYVINSVAIDYMAEKISNRNLVRRIAGMASGRVFSQDDFEREVLLSPMLADIPERPVKDIWKKYIAEGCAIGAYHAGLLGVRAAALICDDAPQFKDILEYLGLCWVHEGRHYKKLIPQNPQFQKCLDDFLDSFWKFYDRLKEYRKHSGNILKKKLADEFDRLFVPNTDYYALNNQIKKTKKKRESLLLVLERPEIPLHNNGAELDIREKVVQRKIRNCFRSWRGARASDTFLSLLATCRKQSISFWSYIRDRILRINAIPPLAEIIRARSFALPIAA